jgi:hypothetical protein
MSSPLDAIGSGLLVGAVFGGIGLGQFLVRRNFFRQVTSEPDHFPIILKPYRWMIIGSHCSCAFILLGFVGLIAFCPGSGAKILGGVGIVVFGVIWISVFRGARQFIRIDPDGFSYVKSSSQAVEVKGRTISTFFAPAVGGNIVVGVKDRPRRVVIPLMFQDINLLNHFLTQWRRENSFK